ncbi:hypothetical protein [Rhizomonospora bruguierae]|uniref:hypothetical protein n=1 Tax=Rhizomonospora bruguierae TaxID=1581705 RepID=UPI0020C156D9|nr:hypothetical protein [Micromonospora sp. NBRC 107566]
MTSLFLLLPILMALWVSITGWNGQGNPFQPGVPVVGARNYTRLLTVDGLARQDFMTSIRNNLYYVLIVVPIQTALSLGLALLVNARILKGFEYGSGAAISFILFTIIIAMTVLQRWLLRERRADR